MKDHRIILEAVRAGHRPTADEVMTLAQGADLAALMEVAGALTRQGHGQRVSDSR